MALRADSCTLTHMTRKHFEAIAANLREHVAAASLSEPTEVHRVKGIILDLAGTFASFNPNFDRKRFLDAAGYNL
jgi:hypothetical protein